MTDSAEPEFCADCGSFELEDTWVIVDDETGAAREEHLCAKCSKQREVLLIEAEAHPYKH